MQRNVPQENLIQLCYFKLIHVANSHASYKTPFDINAIFVSPKYDEASFYIQSKRYTRFETDKQATFLGFAEWDEHKSNRKKWLESSLN